MVRLIRALQPSANSFRSFTSKQRPSRAESRNAAAGFLAGFRSYGSEAARSEVEASLNGIIQEEIQFQSEPAPPTQPPARFGIFEVADKPGDQVVKLKGKFGDSECIEIEVGMFDGCIFVPTPGEDRQETQTNRRMHLSALIHLKKGEGSNPLKVICSAWPDCFEIQKVAVLERDQSQPMPYAGPDFKSVDDRLQMSIYEYLEERGIDDALASFLHEYMKNKDRIELINWFKKLQSLVE
uniref:Mitochondrial glycoprotein n=1 Tax=Kalanchoe fedtschenkoi TaxID=63787 RepID=A0A7N0TAU0_KALFE